MFKVWFYLLAIIGSFGMIAEASLLTWTQPYTTTLFAPGIFCPDRQVEKYLRYLQNKEGVWVATKHSNALINEKKLF